MTNKTSNIFDGGDVTKPPILAVVVPCYNESESLPYTVSTLLTLLDQMIGNCEISDQSFLFFVDDGSVDETWATLVQSNTKDARINALRLSRNFGHQHALLAGLSSVHNDCDVAISIDADLQQDPKSMSAFVKHARAGADIVFGIRVHRDTDGFFKRKTAALFYSLMRLMGVNIIPDHADYRLLSKRALNALLMFPEPHLFLRGLCPMLGFRTATVKFEVLQRKFGETKYSLRKMFRLAVYGVTSLSVVPLRMVSVCGFVCFVISLAMGLYVLWHSLLVGDTVPGWASTTLPIYFLAGVQLLSLGIIGEYVGKIYSTVQNRPRWIARDVLGEGVNLGL